ncbi:MAG TPA: helix-turn-helix domain-containing protein [Rectinema sp.]|nr:helix-turn-helix domain-containing protein [Rectinema sp.]HRU77516.1 helix-turn-helix domain-containing protein [Rectinema sp.]
MDTQKFSFLTVDQVCSILGYKKSYLYKLTHERALPYYKVLGGKIIFDAAEIDALIRKNKVRTRNELSNQADELLNSRGAK